MNCLGWLQFAWTGKGERNSQLAVASNDTVIIGFEQACADAVECQYPDRIF